MDGWVMIKTELDTKLIDKQIKELENELVDLEKQYEEVSTNKMFEWQEEEAKKLRKEINRVNEEIDTLEGQRLKVDMFGNMKNSIDGIGNGITKIVKKVARWGVAIFGVRSAYMAVRGAMSTISENDEQLKADIDYIKDALAYTLEPVVRRIVDLIKQLMFYVAYLTKAWTGKNIFENANKSLKGANKQAKDLKKSMAGFDEMNVISDNSSGGASAGSGFVAPEDAPIPNWIKWIAENKDLVIGGLLGIGTALLLLNLGGLVTNLSGIGTLLSTIWGILQPLFTFIGANAVVIGGIILIIGGLALAIQGLINYLKDPTWENFGTMLLGIGIIATGVLLIFGGFPALITLIVGAIVALGVAIYKNWDNIVAFTKELVQKIKDAFGNAINWVKEKFNSMVNFFSGLISKIVGLFKTIGTKVGDVIGSAFKTVVNGVLKAIENILNFPIKSINKLIDVINKVPGIDLGKLPTFSLPRLAVGGIVNMPSRGVPIGGAITGEAGAEGVIPLTNSQAMETLGQAIGKYININLTNVTKLDNRQIAREQKKINAQSDFAFNR